MSMSKRIQHEGSCTKRPHSGLDGNIFWQCPCGWQIEQGTTTPKKLEDKKERHQNYSRGSMEANRTCSKCSKQWDTITACQAHENQCRGSEEAQRIYQCCNRLFNTVATRRKHEQKKPREADNQA